MARLTYEYDAVVVGAGPNGLAAAITLARSSKAVALIEGASTVGGGCRTAELTLPGFRHDVCSTIHSFAAVSPFIASLPLHEHGLRWVHPTHPLVHPLDDSPAAVLHRSPTDMSVALGQDGPAWERLVGYAARSWERLASDFFRPLVRIPRHPFLLARFGLSGIGGAMATARRRFRGTAAKSLFAGCAAHAMLPLTRPFTAALGVALAASAHAGGWPLAAGGSQGLADALASYLRSLGGVIETGREVGSLTQLPRARVYLLDISPTALCELCSAEVSARDRMVLQRFRHGWGAFKVDYALSRPVPWSDPTVALGGTVHLGGTHDEIAAAEAEVANGRIPDRPFVLVVQPSLFDQARAPNGQHTLWAYTHVPPGFNGDALGPLEAQIERFAPGFKDVVLAKAVLGPAALEDYNPNYVGGDIGGGSVGGGQLFFRPGPRFNPYRWGKGIYLCSASTPPGAGTHGMCGFNAAQVVLKNELA